MPARVVQLQLELADLAAPRHWQRLHRAERQRARALDHQLFIEVAQLPLGFAGRCLQSLRGALGASQRQLGERQAPEQVIPVAVRGQQPAGGGELRLLKQRRQRVELVGQDRRIDHERLAGRAVWTAPPAALPAAWPTVSSPLAPRTITQLTCSSALVTTSTSR